MFDKLKWALEHAWREIRRCRHTSLGIIICYGLSAAIIILTATFALVGEDRNKAILWDIGAHAIFYIPADNAQGCCGFAADEGEGFMLHNVPTELIDPAVLSKVSGSPNVADVSPYLGFVMKSPAGNEKWLTAGFDVSRPKAFSATVVAESQVVAGRFLKADDQQMVMVEKDFATPRGLAPGMKLNLSGSDFAICGIVSPPLRPGKADIYMNIADLRRIVRTVRPVQEAINALIVESRGALYHDAARSDVKNILGQQAVVSTYNCYQPGSQVIGSARDFAVTISLIALVLMVLTAMRTQYASFAERSREAGILLAIGWNRLDIMRRSICEALTLASIGGLAGAILAKSALLLLPFFLPSFQHLPATESLLIFAGGLFLPVIGGLASAGFYAFTFFNRSVSGLLREI